MDTSTLSNGDSAAVTGLKRGSRVAASTACSVTSLPSERWATSEPMHPRSRPPSVRVTKQAPGSFSHGFAARMDAVESAAVGCSICSRSRIAARASFSSTSPWAVPDSPKSSAPAGASASGLDSHAANETYPTTGSSASRIAGRGWPASATTPSSPEVEQPSSKSFMSLRPFNTSRRPLIGYAPQARRG